MNNIKVSIIDDDEDFSYSLNRFLNKQDGIEVISILHSKEEAIDSIPKDNPDVILMDINLTSNNLDGINLTKELFSKKDVKSKIIMLTGIRINEDIVLDSINAGAVNYLEKTNIEFLPLVIKSVMSLNITSIIADGYRKEKANGPLHKLSEHQLKHVKSIFEGMNRQQIAMKLNIELASVKKNLTRIYKILNVKSRGELLVKYDKKHPL